MGDKRATPRSCSYDGVNESARDSKIISDWERGCLWAGIALGTSFALMGILGGLFGW